jgi:hypothetical protein
MKNFVVAAALSAAGFVVSYSGSAADTVRGVPGFLDPSTGNFTPAAASPIVTKVIPAAAVARTGTVKVVITLAIESAIGTDESISCSASFFATDASFDNTASATTLVVRTGATGTATMTIPYDWTMAVTGEPATISVNCTEGNGFSAGGVGHSISFVTPAFVIPAVNGTVTTKTLSASM